MKVSELFESDSVIPPTVWSKLLGKAAALATNDIQEAYNSTRQVGVNEIGGKVEVEFEMHAGSHIGVATIFKKRLKELKLPVYTSQFKENFGDTHSYFVQFDQFQHADFKGDAFMLGWNEVITGNIAVGV